jgi:putative transposase
VVTYERRKILDQPENVRRLDAAFRRVKAAHPFTLDAFVILPDHLHCIWQLPEGEHDFPKRWRLIKRFFSVGIEAPLNRRGEKAVWQRRYWEHVIRNEDDYQRHADYIHYNPVKHSYVMRPVDWPHSSFQRAVARGWYEIDWGQSEPDSTRGLELE